jgi:hypothetical protein
MKCSSSFVIVNELAYCTVIKTAYQSQFHMLVVPVPRCSIVDLTCIVVKKDRNKREQTIRELKENKEINGRYKNRETKMRRNR